MEGRSGHVVRLIHRGTNNRALLKGFTGPVLDIAFATSATSLLACVDQGGNVFVWDLSKTDSTLSDVNRYTSSSSPSYYLQREGVSLNLVPHNRPAMFTITVSILKVFLKFFPNVY